MTREPPPPMAGLRHVALRVGAFDACLHFYTEILGMKVEWQPDRDTAFLTSGHDNLALHRASEPPDGNAERLDHMGFIVDAIDDVDRWYGYLSDRDVPIENPPKTHRDGARSFFCEDPAGTRIQVLYHPPISAG